MCTVAGNKNAGGFIACISSSAYNPVMLKRFIRRLTKKNDRREANDQPRYKKLPDNVGDLDVSYRLVIQELAKR